MAWSMPTGQWNSGISMTPDMNMANMGSYTPEQWALMQQQNWQQWAQWQQQYAQWQSQYGDKYTQHMQALHAMSGVPPPAPNAVPPPAPPPPEKPPPPPHENNQPLYGNTPSQTQSVSHTSHLQYSKVGYNEVPKTGNNFNQTSTTDSMSDLPTPQVVNTDALVKLAEEERLFDIQFQKWEEEIKKWKNENVNHPDKRAYMEYEQKFASCRAQLLERRQQMKLKRDRLMGVKATQTANTTMNSAGNISTSIPPPTQNINKTNYNTNVQNSQTKNNATQNYINQNQSQYESIGHLNQTSYNRSNKNSVEHQDRYEYYGDMSNDYTTSSDTSNFLPTNDAFNGIPGLDLVPDGDKSVQKQLDVIDITEERKIQQPQQNIQAPDYSKISKGINNILGDEKIMNILSMMSSQNTRNESKVGSVGSQRQDLNNQPGNMQYSGNNSSYHGNNYNNMQSRNMPYQQSNENYTNQASSSSYTDPDYQRYGCSNEQNENIRSNDMDKNFEYNRLGNQNIPQNRSNMPRPMPNFHPKQSDYPQGDYMRRMDSDIKPIQPLKPKWVDEPLFTPSIIVEYEHKPLRLKARDFIEPVHMFEYNHQSKDGESSNKKNFDKELDDLFSRKRRADDDWSSTDKFYSRDYDRRGLKDDARDRNRTRDDRDMYDRRIDDRRRDDRDRFRREEYDRRDRVEQERSRDMGRGRDERDRDRDMGRERESGRDRDYMRDRDRDIRGRSKEYRKDDRDSRNRSRSRDKENRKRGHSRETESIDNYGLKKNRDVKNETVPPNKPKHVVMIDDLLELPGRTMRPEKMVIILRGPPGSGKSYLAKLIRDKEAEHGGTARIMSIDDYFMQEGEIEEKDPNTGKIVKKPSLKYEYDESSEESYLSSLKRAFKRSITDGYFTFLIYDAVNDQLKSYADIWNFSRQNSFQVYICTMEMDPQACFKRNIHNRSLEDIENIVSRFFPTPAHHIQLDPTTLLQSASIREVQMEDADDVTMEEVENPEVDNSFTSKWEKMEDAAQLARLDGTSRPLRSSQLSMEDYLQLDDWKPNTAKPGKKTVRWADIEERRQQEKMRAIGFVVGQTDWNRMTDPTMGSSALTQTKYIERVRRH
ncbi:unnamed protein product [Danaus chrysippus]|uniref:YLP motif-containing protein 1 n=1 Tax=Danaus chrysippus TaxID=151541 RepID=A0A8J2WDB9_9NEOP|nr:unnamed protein product [Danaus chrysippus]